MSDISKLPPNDFLKNLNSKNAKETTKNLVEAQKEINEAGPETFDAISEMSFNLGGPFKSLGDYFAGQLQAGTIDAQMTLFTELMQLFQSEAGKATIQTIADVLSFIINNAATIINVFDYILNFLYGLAEQEEYRPGGISQFWKELF